MKIAIACDHGGFPLKAKVVETILAEGHEVIDLGTHSPDPVDYPDYARAIGEAIQQGQAERGVLLCGSGVGACVAANKMRGIRAGVCHDTYSAHQGVEHDDMNVLTLGARIIGPELAPELVRAFLNARFTGEERHVRRLGKVRELEEEQRRGRKKKEDREEKKTPAVRSEVFEKDPRLDTRQITSELLTYIAEKIAREIAPQKIILFGSRARDEAREDSDLDLFVIQDSPMPNRLVRRRIDLLLWGRDFSLDLIVRRPEEVERNLADNNPFYTHHIFKYGRVLYERPTQTPG